jgi:hypothetical protein
MEHHPHNQPDEDGERIHREPQPGVTPSAVHLTNHLAAQYAATTMSSGTRHRSGGKSRRHFERGLYLRIVNPCSI